VIFLKEIVTNFLLLIFNGSFQNLVCCDVLGFLAFWLFWLFGFLAWQLFGYSLKDWAFSIFGSP